MKADGLSGDVKELVACWVYAPIGWQNAVMAILRLFAQARESAGVGSIEISGTTVGEVLDGATTQFGSGFATIVSNSKVWVNGEPAASGDSVGGNDEVAVLPPVSGG